MAERRRRHELMVIDGMEERQGKQRQEKRTRRDDNMRNIRRRNKRMGTKKGSEGNTNGQEKNKERQ